MEEEKNTIDSDYIIGSVMEVAGAESIPELGEGPRIVKTCVSTACEAYTMDD